MKHRARTIEQVNNKVAKILASNRLENKSFEDFLKHLFIYSECLNKHGIESELEVDSLGVCFHFWALGEVISSDTKGGYNGAC